MHPQIYEDIYAPKHRLLRIADVGWVMRASFEMLGECDRA